MRQIMNAKKTYLHTIERPTLSEEKSDEDKHQCRNYANHKFSL